MALPAQPPGGTLPTAFESWGSDVADTATDHESRLDAIEGLGSLATDAELAAGLATKQPLDTDLTAIAALTSAANKLPYATGSGTWSLADITAFARQLLDDGDAATARATLGLILGTDIYTKAAVDALIAGLSATYVPGIIAASGDGIDYSGVLDSTTALQALLDRAQDEGLPLYLLPGTLKVSGLTTTSQDEQPRIVGAGAHYTTLTCSAAGVASITFVGGSGHVAGSVVEGIRFAGAGAYGIEFQGSNGIIAQRCEFASQLAKGVLFHNEAVGQFTEHVLVRDCHFLCARAIEYLVTNGNESFHGTGFDGDTLITQPAGTSTASIYIGTGCLVYNAPWSGRLNVVEDVSPIENASGTRAATVWGSLRIENFAGSDAKTIVKETSTLPVYYAGTIEMYAEGITLGSKMRRVDRTLVNGDYSVVYESATPLPLGYVTGASYGNTGAASAVRTMGGTEVRAVPVLVRSAQLFDRIGIEVTTEGDAGAVYRLGVWNHNPLTGRPGTLVLDAGTVAGDALGYQAATISLFLEPGWYWMGAVLQTVLTGSPAIRSVTGAPALPMASSVGSGMGTTNNLVYSGVSGALSSLVGATPSLSQNAPVIQLRAA